MVGRIGNEHLAHIGETALCVSGETAGILDFETSVGFFAPIDLNLRQSEFQLEIQAAQPALNTAPTTLE